MDEVLGRLMGLVAGIVAVGFILYWVVVAIAWVVGVILTAIAWVVGTILYVIALVGALAYAVGDWLFASGLFGWPGWIMWSFWGLVIGGLLGFWTIAPVYGIRGNRRKLMLVGPTVLMVLLAVLAHV